MQPLLASQQWLFAAAVNPANAIPLTHPRRRVCCRSPADRRQAGLLRPPARIKNGKRHHPVSASTLTDCGLLAAKSCAQPQMGKPPKTRFCPEGVGAWLAGDLLRSSSKPCERNPPDAPVAGFAAGPRQIVGKPDSYGLRPESEAVKGITRSTHQPIPDCWLWATKTLCPAQMGKPAKTRFCPEGVGAWLASDLLRSSSKPCERNPPDTPPSPGLLPVPGRSSASRTPTASGKNQKR